MMKYSRNALQCRKSHFNSFNLYLFHRCFSYKDRIHEAKNFKSKVDLHSEDSTRQKDILISRMKFKNSEDASPFYKLPIRTLFSVLKATQLDNKFNYCENRLYYLSDKIKCPPKVVSVKLAKRTFIYTLSFNWMEDSLNVLVDMGVSSNRILRDLWVVKYNSETIHRRLQYVKDKGIDTLQPWMVRCSEDILNRFIQISQDTKNILGDDLSIKLYLSNRLNTSPEVVEDLFTRLPALETIRVTKLKGFLDFLIEEGFEVSEILNKSRVLTASQHTVKERLHKLRKLGINNINLNILCRSRKDFQKYCEIIESVNKDKQNDANIDQIGNKLL